MLLTVLKLFSKTALSLGLLATALGFFLLMDKSPILIESEESKTLDLKPVFNKITWKPGFKKDIWMMKQSQHGTGFPDEKWDRIAIVVDKTKSPKQAEFYQLEPGPLDWEAGLKKIEYKVSCFLCHSNGPRAIRPQFDSNQAKLSFWNKMRISMWNLRVKTYGRVVASSKGGKVSFRYPGTSANKTLNSQTCNKCHSENGFLARGQLTRQNFMSIRFMVQNGHMPPPGFRLSRDEKSQILEFAGISTASN